MNLGQEQLRRQAAGPQVFVVFGQAGLHVIVDGEKELSEHELIGRKTSQETRNRIDDLLRGHRGRASVTENMVSLRRDT